MNWYKKAQSAKDESLNGTELTVYHRTREGTTAENICTSGFISGGGAMYGRGVYATRNLASSLQNYNLSTYGAVIVKSTVDLNGFIIFDYDIAKRIYGNNYKLTDQMKNLRIIKSISPSLIESSKRLNNVKFSSDVARKVIREFNLSSNGAKGVLYTGRSDGKCMVCYQETSVIPEAHAWIDGRTFKNPQWKSCPEGSSDVLKKMQDSKDREKYIKERDSLNNMFDRYANNEEPILLSKNNYPQIPEPVFDSMIVDFLYKDPKRADRLTPDMKNKFKDVIEVDFLLKEFKEDPVYYWNKLKSSSQEIRDRIPDSVIVSVWDNYIENKPDRWVDIPEEMKPFVSKDPVVKLALKAVRTNEKNWKYIPKEIILYMNDTLGISVPNQIIKDVEKPEIGAWENLGEKEEGPETQGETSKIEIHVSSISWIENELEKLNKRAQKLGLPPLHYKVTDIDRAKGTKMVKIFGNVPILKGWKLIAEINPYENDEGKYVNSINPISAEVIPPEYITAKPTCEHCNINRFRNSIYILHHNETGEYKTVGSTCMGAFLSGAKGNKTPRQIAEYATKLYQAIIMFSEGDKYKDKSPKQIVSSFKKNGIPVDFFLGKVTIATRKSGGFVSSSQAYKDGSLQSTADTAYAMCTNTKVDEQIRGDEDVNATDMTLITSALKWIAEIDPPPPSVDPSGFEMYLWNVHVICESGIITSTTYRKVGPLLSMYERREEQEVEYDRLIGEIGEEIVFNGILNVKKPIFFSIQQDTKKKKITQTYCIATDKQRNKIAVWSENIEIQAEQGEEISVRGKISGYSTVDNVSATILVGVEEISKKDYIDKEPEMDARIKEFEEKHKGEGIEKRERIKQTRDYKEGEIVEDEFTISGIKKYRNNLYFLKDKYNNKLSTFTNLDLGKIGETIKIKGEIQFNQGYTNLINVSFADQPDQPAQAAPTKKAPPYQDGEQVEDDFRILDTQFFGQYNSNKYKLEDSSGRNLSMFKKINANDKVDPIGDIGETVRLRGRIKIKGQYVNLTYAKIVSKPQPQIQPQVQPTQPQPQIQPQQPTILDDEDNNIKTQQFNMNWYKKAIYELV